jgi:hypothetical protein
MTIRRTVIGVMAAAMLVMNSGCSRSPVATFYTMSALAPEAAAASADPPGIAVGPVTVPELVNRPQLVTRISANTVNILESHRWAEPLKSEIPRLLAENLARLLRPARVSTYDQSASHTAEYRVVVDILRFESVPEKGVTIEALWSVRRGAEETVEKGHSIAQEPTDGTGYEALVAAHGRALATISKDMARALASSMGHP